MFAGTIKTIENHTVIEGMKWQDEMSVINLFEHIVGEKKNLMSFDDFMNEWP